MQTQESFSDRYYVRGVWDINQCDKSRIDPGCILANDVTFDGEYNRYNDGEYNPHNTRLWLISHQFGPVCMVWAQCEQDALDEMVDSDLGNAFLVSEEDVNSASEEEREAWARLGNTGEYADLTYCHMEAIKLDPTKDWRLMLAFAEARGAGSKTIEEYWRG